MAKAGTKTKATSAAQSTPDKKGNAVKGNKDSASKDKVVSSKSSRKKKGKVGTVKRIMKLREPKLIENAKKMLFLRGSTASNTIQCVLKDLCKLKGMDGKNFSKKNDIRPFEDASSLEFLSDKNDTSLFAFGSHSKKRPDNLVMGRMFDHKLLDMVEFSVTEYTRMDEFTSSIGIGTKPAFIFKGLLFDNDEVFKEIKNILLDTFRGEIFDKLSLAGVEWVICVTVDDETKVIHFRPYCIQLVNSGTRLPRVELEPLGPFLDLSVGRHQFATEDIKKMSLKKPKGIEPNKKKNITRNVFGEKVGRLHMQTQDMDLLQTRKMKGLKVKKGEKEIKEVAGGDNEVEEDD